MEKEEEELYWGVTPKKVPQDPPPIFEDKSKAKACSKCSLEFGRFTSKYNCSACGKVFCKKDCDRWLLLPDSFKYDPVSPIRVCGDCYERYNLVDFSRDYDEFGSKDDPSVLVIPGALCPRIVPPCFLNGLKGYHVISPDLPGFGSRKNEILTNENALETIKEAILTHAKEKKALILGFSMGGHVAMKFAHKYPELCTGLILGACVNEYYGFKADMFFKSSQIVYDVSPNSFNAKLFGMVAPKEHLKEARWIMAEGMQYHMWTPCSALMAEPHKHFYREALAAMTIPIIFIHGTGDFRFGEKAFMEAAKTAELCLIEGANHALVIIPEYYNQLTKKIQEFADKVYGK